jgi:hypothetical protein
MSGMGIPDPTGPDLIRAAIQRDRGGHLAPTQPVIICGEPDPKAMRADDPRWPGNRIPTEPRRGIATCIAEALICPGCLCLRFGPGHLSRKIAGIDCRHV